MRQRNIIPRRRYNQFSLRKTHDFVDMAADARVFFIAVEEDGVGPLVGGGHFPHDLEGAVGGTVVGEDDLEGGVGLGECALNRIPDEALLVVGNEGKGDQGAIRQGFNLSPTR